MVTGLVDEKEFHALIEKRAQSLLSMASYLSKCRHPQDCLTRPLLGELLAKAMLFEELLDTYDAGRNCTWCNLRSLTATLKLFSDVSYELLHVRHRLPGYRLLPAEQDFVAATNEALEFTGGTLVRTAQEILATAQALNLSIPPDDDIEDFFSEQLPKGHLTHDCEARRAETVAETVTLLATAFLNLASVSEDVRAASRIPPQEYAHCVDTLLSEEHLRSLELQFHNLQSQYDTYVSGTEVERQDTDLPVLRGHASVVFHLLKTATSFAHYYERHVKKQRCVAHPMIPGGVNSEALISVLMRYSITYIDQYIGCAVHLCQDMLKRYAETGSIEVSIPKYRGFHVRPSTLIAELVLHYGSKVTMTLDGQEYNAGSSLDLFRANEKINAQKRRWLAEEIVRLQLVRETPEPHDVVSTVCNAVLALAARGRLIMYKQPLELPENLCRTDGTLVEKVINETHRLLTMGRIDISIDMKARFEGDMRVLEDIKLLAEHGYGEDSFGNNIALPDKLTYLRR